MRKLLALSTLVLALGGASATSTAQASGDRWDYLVRNCEAPGSDNAWWRGGWYANTGNGFYGGPQFTYGTWRAHGGPRFSGRGRFPFSIALQKAVADRVMRSQGPWAWPTCHRLGYI